MQGLLRRTVSIAVLVVAAGLAVPLQADELRGVALVIGQADYESLGDLGNPLNDARAMDEMLSDLGFDVTRVLDRGGDRLRREIEDFISDAEGADIALVYYAGHAVEAAGQNYLVPIDANLATPVTAGESLVPVGDLLDELARTVPVTIMLLDACRTDAFPDGTAIQLPGSDVPVTIAATGLGEMRGPTPMLASIDPESLGMVIGFASSPGEAALDGPAGTNSPYAAALLKHLGAGGYAFGDLMTMVTEEVYLKTGAQQIPWMNSSLRRVLSFETVEETDGDEALIRDGRRRLLLSIAARPNEVRKQVETAAASADVPMDTLYGLLDALGQDAPSDPAALDQLLKTQTETIRKVMEERQALSSTDIEIVRLAGLAQRALDEGALAVSVGFWEQAKSRYLEISANLDTTEAQLRERRLEGGALLARTAEAYRLSGNYAAAAENYSLAFNEVQRWDVALARQYKWGQADALNVTGVQRGANEALRAAIDAYGSAISLAEIGSAQWASMQYDLGGAYAQLGSRDGRAETLDAAVAAYEASLSVRTKQSTPLGWATVQTGIGATLSIAGELEVGTTKLKAAIAAYEAALEVLEPETSAYDWSMAQNNLGNTLRVLGEREAGTGSLLAAIDAFRAALSVRDRDRAPLDWALTQNNLGIAQMLLGTRQGGSDSLRGAVHTFEGMLEVATRERVPLLWAKGQSNLGTTLKQLGDREGGTRFYEQAASAYRAALTEITLERSPTDWAIAQNNLGNVFAALGESGAGAANFQEAVEIYRAVLASTDRSRSPKNWAMTQNNLGATLTQLALTEPGNAEVTLRAAVESLRAALLERTRDTAPSDWALTQYNLAKALVALGLRAETGTESLAQGVMAFQSALTETSREMSPSKWAVLQKGLGNALLNLGLRETGVASFQLAVDAYNATMEVQTYEADPLAWASNMDSIGWTIANAGLRLGDRNLMLEGQGAIRSAWDAIRAAGNHAFDDYFSERINTIDRALDAQQTAP